MEDFLQLAATHLFQNKLDGGIVAIHVGHLDRGVLLTCRFDEQGIQAEGGQPLLYDEEGKALW